MKSSHLLFATLVSLSGVAEAQTCTPVTKCEVISNSGTYCPTPQGTFTSSSGDCFVISAPNVTLENSGPSTIRGGGTGAGVHVLSTATHFSYGLFCPSISSFNAGIQDDANGAVFSNSNDCPTVISNVNYGVYFNHVTGSSYYGGFSGNPGVQARNSAVWISGGGHNFITSDAPSAQKQFFRGAANALLIENSTGNAIYGIEATNSSQGIFIEGGGGNLVYDNVVTENGTGIRVKYDSPGNFIAGNDATGNSSYDLFQGTTSTTVGCNGDFWLNNTFATANQNCIN